MIEQPFVPKCISVYCGSSSQVETHYFEEAAKLGEILTHKGVTVAYGAGQVGVMGSLADSVLKNGGKIIGIIPQFMVDAGWCHPHLTETIITKSMHERKAKIAEMSDVAIALPGGIGTMEELLEILTWKQLGLTTKPIIIVNTNGYFNNLLDMFNRAISEKFMRNIHQTMWTTVLHADEVWEAICNAPTWDKNQQKIAAI